MCPRHNPKRPLSPEPPSSHPPSAQEPGEVAIPILGSQMKLPGVRRVAPSPTADGRAAAVRPTRVQAPLCPVRAAGSATRRLLLLPQHTHSWDRLPPSFRTAGVCELPTSGPVVHTCVGL